MAPHGLFVVLPELTFENAIYGTPPLLLSQLKATVRHLSPSRGTLAGREGALLERALGRETFLALQVELVAQTPANAANGSGISSHLALP
jgi:hypothetical protein